MDLDSGLVTALLDGGEPAFQQYLSGGTSTNWVYSPWKAALEFSLDFRRQHGSLPSKQVVEQKVPGLLFNGNVADPITFFMEEVRKRFLFNLLHNGMKGVAASLEKLDPLAGLQALQRTMEAVQKGGAVTSKIVPLDNLVDDVVAYYNLMKSGVRGILSPWPTMDTR